MNKRSILIAEDEEAIRMVLADALRTEGYEVHEAANGRRALELLLTLPIDLALLDINMPEVTGFKLLKIMQKECPTVPSIILTAHGEEKERIKGLELGADDYVVKPFSMAELQARIKAVLRRYPGQSLARPQVEQRFPGGKLCPNTRALLFDDGRESSLSEKEFELFAYFLTHPNRIIAQDELLLRIWKSTARASETRTVAVTLARLKEKLGADASAPFSTVRGSGYQWTPPTA